MRSLNLTYFSSVRGRLTLFAGGILFPALLLVSWVLLRAYENDRGAMEWQLQSSSAALGQMIDSHLESKEALLRGLASSRTLLNGDLESFRAQAASVVNGNEEWIVLIDEHGKQLVNTLMPPGAPLPSVAFAPEFRAAALAGRTYISNVRVGPASGRHILFVAVPVMQDGALRYTLNFVVSPANLSELLRSAHVRPTWIVALMDREDTVAARNRDAEKLVGAKATSEMLVGLSSDAPRLARAIAFDGTPTIFVAHRSKKSGWALVVAAPVTEIFAPAREILIGAVIATLVCVASGMVVAAWFGRGVVNGVNTLVSGAGAVGRGEPFTEKPTGLKEIDQVAGALRDSAAKLTARELELSRTRDEALEASRAKDEFLATLSHELRTPLNPVLLLASDAAVDPELTPALRSTFGTIAKNVALEARLIDDLLDLTRVSRGTLRMNRERVDVHAVLHETLKTVDLEFADKQLHLELDLTAPECNVEADPVRLQQVFWNLLKNAAKFTDPGGRVTIRSRARDENKLEVTFTDTGIGMTPEEIQRSFQRFSTGDHRYGGLGLGLSICRAIVDLLGGSITVASAGRGLGTTFAVCLPLASPRAASPGSPPSRPRAAAVQPPQTSGSILLVEDHEASRVALERSLRRRGYHVTAARNVAEARSKAAASSFDLVISDIGLPDGNGYELMRWLKENYGHAGIALTGYGMEDDVREARAAGFIDHLVKPVNSEALDAALRRATARAV